MYGYMCRWLDLIVCSHFNMFNFKCISQIRNVEILSKLHYNVYGIFYSKFCHQHIWAAIATIFRVILLYCIFVL